MMYYKSYRIIDGKPRWIIVDETSKMVNASPSKDELIYLKYEPSCRRKGYTDEELLNFLVQFDKENGRVPMQLDFNGNPRYPSFMTYHNRFGSWNKALDKLGLNTIKGSVQLYTDEELLDFLMLFYKENERAPTEEDFSNHPEYPNFSTYVKHFGSWEKAKKLVGLDTETMVKKGILDTPDQKARLAEKMILEHFDKNPVDLSGENCRSSCDGICPNGKTYDVKSSKLIRNAYWQFDTDNKYKEEIEIYYFLAFNEDYTKLEYAWRVPGEIVEKDNFYVGMYGGKFNVGNMIEYEITDKLDKIQERGT